MPPRCRGLKKQSEGPPSLPGLKKQSEGPPDLLSNLPAGIIAKILGHVPIREAVRTSVLSRHWRCIWCNIPNLKFDGSCVKLPTSINRLGEHLDSPFVSFVNRVLLLHQGPVHKFEISGKQFANCSDINQWVTFLSRNGVEELSLQFGYNARAPSSLFQCSKLTALRLWSFHILELPVSFEGFKSLKKLDLQLVKIAISSLEKLISGCPLLEILVLYDSHSEVLKIHAPLLKYLYLQGKFQGFIFEKTPLLEVIEVMMFDEVTEHGCNLFKFIDQVPSLQKLVGLGYFAKYWNVGKDPTIITMTHNHLRFIKLSIDFEDPTEVHLLIRLIRNSPVLKELEIIGEGQGSSSEGTDGSVEFWSEAHNVGCHIFSQLKKVTVTTTGSSNEIEFAKFMLLNSPTLETMKMSIPSSDIEDRRMKLLVDLLRCRRASTKAEVVLCDV